MNIVVQTINIPGISPHMLKMVQKLDFLVEKLSCIQDHNVMHAPELSITMYRHWLNETQTIHQDLIRLGIEKSCNNHPMWTVLDKMVKQEVSRVLSLIEKRLNNQ